MDLKIELVAMPVSDVDCAKAFYTEKLGFAADHDVRVSDDLRFVQLTPPGSACSICFGVGVTEAPAGSVKGTLMVVADIEEAHHTLSARGLEVGDIEDLDWGRFIYFADPDGNTWAVQQLPNRQTA